LRPARLAPLLLIALLGAGCGLRPDCPAGLRTVASGLTHPRSVAVASDGTMFVAEAGNDEIGGRISRVSPDGQRTTLVAGLPHSVNAGVEDVGTAGVALRDDELYAIEGEASGELASALFRVGMDGRAERVSDLLAYENAANPDGAGVESNPFGLLYDRTSDRFYVTDGAGNDVVRVAADGRVETAAAWRDDPVPTGLGRAPGGRLHVALFGGFPHGPGMGRVDRVEPDGSTRTVLSSLTMPIGVAWDAGQMYVLEFAGGLDLQPRLQFRPRSGRLLRVVDGRPEPVLEGLQYPTFLQQGPNGGLMIGDRGAMSTPGSGRVLQAAACGLASRPVAQSRP
jgi:sugar lactone lactonase YvrE